MPDARCLFKRAILQSSPAGVPPFSEASALDYGNRLLQSLGIAQGNTKSISDSLKAESTIHILEAMGKVARSTARFAQVTPPFMPVFDSLASTERFIEIAGKGAGIAGVDIIIGTTREEVNAFFCGDTTMQAPDLALVAERFAALTGKEGCHRIISPLSPRWQAGGSVK